MFKFCPSCASKNIAFKDGKVFRCPDCGFVYYHNIAAATGCVISVPSSDGERIVLLVRGKEPAIGKLDLPGGFVDIGEGVIEGLHRELREEIGWTPPIPPTGNLAQVYNAGRRNRRQSIIPYIASPEGAYKLFASFSNVYKYKGIDYNTCDMYFSISAPGLTQEDLHLEKAEIAGVLFQKPEEINFEDFAFESTKKAIKAYLSL
jgi:ADP-ribose pyrophosphatase YjhB (NUDIX family)